jgi:pimeloyl-ACP methyl ester carboxylesterase
MDIPHKSIAPSTPAREDARRLTLNDGVSMGYRLWRAPDNPSRRLIVLLHGVASNLTRWAEFVEHTTLKDSWDILRVDLRGHGESFSRAPLGMSHWCQDLVNLLDQEGYENALLIGHSLGAQVAVEFAARRRGRVSGLVLIDPLFRGALHGSALWIRRLTPLLWLIVGFIRLLNALGLRRRHIPPRDLRQLDEQTRASMLNLGKQEEMIARYTSPLADLKHFAAAPYLQELIEVTRPLPSLAGIPIPTLVLLSRGVTFSDPEITKRLLAPLPHVRVISIDAYHWPLTEKPVEVRQAIERWCAEVMGQERPASPSGR